MSTRDVSLRIALPGDAARIALMSRDLIEGGLGWSWTQTRVSKGIANPDTLSIVLRDDDSVIGFAMMYFGDEHAHLNLLAVQPTFQRTGLGTRMIRWLEESARVAGVRAVHLEVRARNQHARRFYRRLGFLEMALLPKYYRGIEAAVWMARDLRVATQRRVV